MKRKSGTHTKNLNFLLATFLLAACSLEKPSGFNRDMQNLTAKYNILFNADELLRLKQESIAQNFQDNFQDILKVYQDTAAKSATPDKDMEAAIDKSKIIINRKDQSHYIPDAYFDMAKANYLKGSYFNSVEFFNYIIRSYPKRKELTLDAMAWKARALMQIGRLDLADTTLDTALMKLDTAGFNRIVVNNSRFAVQNTADVKKKSTYPEPYVADVFATRLQYDIYTKNYIDAEEMAVKAIKYTRETDHRLRWIYILAQIQDINHHTTQAVENFTRIENSNAPFEMAFNASLNRIRIQDEKGTGKLSRIELLRRLLKDDKNKDFIDQIYFQIGELYLAQNKTDEAVKNYLLSAHTDSKNLNQKGMAYLRIADIDFSNKADYAGAKKYYDSTLLNLSHAYPEYAAIKKKNANLQYLTDRLQTISREDTLQMLGKLTDSVRILKVDEMFKRISLQQQKTPNNTSVPFNSPITSANQTPAQNSTASSGAGSNFYFYNTSAVSQGYSDFKKVWGNRPLTDDWRRSQNNNALPSSTVSPVFPASIGNAKPDTTTNAAIAGTTGKPPADKYAKAKQEVLKSVPVTAGQVAISNSRIYNAYMDIANLYRDVLDDKKDAIATYEIVLNRFSEKVNKPLIYYNLYRLYSDVDTAKSTHYKNLILSNYAETTFAKIITDPDYFRKLNDKNAVFNTLYDSLFNIVEHRRYHHAIDTADMMIHDFANNVFIAQVYYLRAMAEGHLQKLEPFKAELEEIRDKFGNDQLIAPLVKQHLAFIAANNAEMTARPVVLIDENSTEVPFAEKADIKADRYNLNLPQMRQVKAATAIPAAKQSIAQVKGLAIVPDAPTVLPKKKSDTVTAKLQAVLPTQILPKPVDTVKTTVVASTPIEPPSIFSMNDSSNYFFVIWVKTNKVDLASSRFGIGQFDRAHYEGNVIKHQLKNVGSNQLVYVGRFISLADVKNYARGIVPLLPSIMKIAPDEYCFFMVTQENLDKLVDQKTLESYYSYYQKHY